MSFIKYLNHITYISPVFIISIPGRGFYCYDLTDFVYHAGMESNRFSEERDRFTYKFWKCVLGF